MFQRTAFCGALLLALPVPVFNQTHVPGHTQFNLGLSHEFIMPDWKPFTVRFDVVNLFDHIYELRDGTGVGVFAPQYGPRRGFFQGFAQKF